MNQCPICWSLGQTTMCHSCMGKLYRCLQAIAVFAPELENELTKQTAKVSKMQRATGGSTPLVYSPDASELAIRIGRTLIKWCTYAMPYVEAPTHLANLARFAFHHYRRLARLPDSDLMYAELSSLRAELDNLVDLPVERVFLGTCAACGASIHGERVTEYLECRCGAQLDVQAAKRATRVSIEDSWLTPKETKEYLKGKGAVITSQQLSNWGREEKVRKQVTEGISFYLLSTVLAYAETRGLLESTRM